MTVCRRKLLSVWVKGIGVLLAFALLVSALGFSDWGEVLAFMAVPLLFVIHLGTVAVAARRLLVACGRSQHWVWLWALPVVGYVATYGILSLPVRVLIDPFWTVGEFIGVVAAPTLLVLLLARNRTSKQPVNDQVSPLSP